MPRATTPGRVRRGLGVEAASDEQLVARAQDGDDRSLTLLLRRYRRFTRAKARSYFLVGGEREDIVQEGMIGLYKAIRDYSHEERASFRSFAELCITRQILTAIKTATRQKHTPLNTYVSFDRPCADDATYTVGETILVAERGEHGDPLSALVAADELEALRRAFDALLSELEGDVLELYVQGRSYQEIAELLGRHVKSIDNALQRIKRKLEQHLAQRDGQPAEG